MPRTVDHEERRAAILEAFVRVAVREGLYAVALRAVAVEAGVSLRLVQYYFETKAGLMRAGLEFLERQSNSRWAQRVAELPRPATARATLWALFEEALPTDKDSRDFHLLWMSYAVFAQSDDQISHRAFTDGPNRLQQHIASLLQQGVASGEFRADLDVEVEAAILIGLLHGFGTAVLVEQKPADVALNQLRLQLGRLSCTRVA